MRTTTIKDFKKEKVIGKGSFGSVFLVRRVADNKIYALKTVILDKLNKKEQENSVNEVRILASINHPNVIGYKEAFWEDKTSSLNIVMEYADDGDLQSKIIKMKAEGGFFKESLIWEYSIQMIEGLKALHDKKIMHRDLKSANIFLFKENHLCKLGDMNVSKVIKEKVLLTQTGTPYYASPEVWRDEPYSYKSDLWSIGCVIYELCELHPPFKGKDLDELFEDVCLGKPKRINKIYSNELWTMIMMLLQVDVEKRVDCDMFLKSKLITDKIQEMKNNPNIYNLRGINLGMNSETIDQALLHTIKFSNLNEIKYQLPTTKNYTYNYNNNYLKSPIINKSPFLSKKSSRNKYSSKNNNNQEINANNKEVNINNNNQLLIKLKDIQMKKENIRIKLKMNKLKNNKENYNINNYDSNNKSQHSKNDSKREIRSEQNSDQKECNNKLIYNKSEVFDKNNKYTINQIKRLNTDNSKSSIFKSNRLLPVSNNKYKENLRIKIPKNNKYKKIPTIQCNNSQLLTEYLKHNYCNISITPSRQMLDKNNIPINYYNKLLKNNNSIPISTSSSNINHKLNHINNCQSFDGNKDIYKPIKCITQHNRNSNVMNIPTGKEKYKLSKEYKLLRKMSPDTIKRKNTYTKDNNQLIKERRANRIQAIFIKRNKSLNFDNKNIYINRNNININRNNLRILNNCYRNKNLHKINNSDILPKDTSFNSINSKPKKVNSSYERIINKNNDNYHLYHKKTDENLNINIKLNKNLIKNCYYHQKYPTISSVQQSMINNFNKYKNISSNIKIKRISNNKTLLSKQLNLQKNILNSNIRIKKIHLKKKHINTSHRKNNQSEIATLMNYIEKSINNSDLTEDNFDKSTINKTSINKSTIPNVGFNDFLKKMKPINNENESNNCKKVIVSSINKMKNNNNYLSPKITSSQVFNNYYSFNNVETTHIPVKVINIYKK